MEMDHPRIDEEKIVDRYLVGRLSSQEEALFEEHLFACETCLEAVEAGDELRRGLRAVAAEDATVASIGFLAWWQSRPAMPRAGLVGLALAASLLAFVVFWPGDGPIGPGDPAGAAAGPRADFLVVTLGAVRDAGRGVEEAPTIRLDPARETLLLSLELPAVEAPTYRATLRTADGAGDGERLWRGTGLEPSPYESLLLAVPSSYLAPGTYRVEIEGEGEPTGDSLGVTFRVVSR